jgi:hypothetical protein
MHLCESRVGQKGVAHLGIDTPAREVVVVVVVKCVVVRVYFVIDGQRPLYASHVDPRLLTMTVET